MTSELTERIEQSVARAVTPNEMVFAEVRAEREVSISFSPGYYYRANTAQITGDLGKIARLLFAAGRKEHLAQLEAVTGRPAESRTTPLSGRDAEYYSRLAELEAEGASDDGSVSVTAIGQQNYAVQIRPGTLDRLSEEEFCRACNQAADRLIADTEQQAAAIRWEIYFGTPLPGVG